MKAHSVVVSMVILIMVMFSCNSHNTGRIDEKPAVGNADSLVLTEAQTNKLDSIVSLIIDISANDFYKNQTPAPVQFKDVTLKFIKKDNGEELYILCGHFVTSNKEEIPFATVKNIDYEQWLGSGALSYCQNSKEISYNKQDLCLALTKKFNALKNLPD